MHHVARHLPHKPGWGLVWKCVVVGSLASGGAGWTIHSMLPPTPIAPDVFDIRPSPVDQFTCWVPSDGDGIACNDGHHLSGGGGAIPKHVPEPSSLALLAAGIAFFALRRR